MSEEQLLAKRIDGLAEAVVKLQKQVRILNDRLSAPTQDPDEKPFPLVVADISIAIEIMTNPAWDGKICWSTMRPLWPDATIFDALRQYDNVEWINFREERLIRYPCTDDGQPPLGELLPITLPVVVTFNADEPYAFHVTEDYIFLMDVATDKDRCIHKVPRNGGL